MASSPWDRFIVRSTEHAFGLLTFAALLITLGGCGGPPKARTTFLNSVDLVAMTDQMAASFAHDEVISQRSLEAESELWVISMNRIANHTNQIIPDREKWLYMARLRSLLAQSEIGRERNLVWVVPPEQWSAVQDELHEPFEPAELRMKPTHQLTAEFFALTNSAAMGRSDTYHCAYVLVDLESGTEVWRGAWEVKHWVEGRTYD